MKDSMIEMMLLMMPYMKPFMWSGVVIATIGILLLLVSLWSKSNTASSLHWAAGAIFVISGFFILAQIAGYFLSMPPTINFGDSSKFEFILVSFWQISIAFFVVALILKFSTRAKVQSVN